MAWVSQRSAQVGMSVRLAGRALKSWHARQVIAGVIAALLVALVIGFARVLSPSDLLPRDIPPTWWDHPVWTTRSRLSGVLIATYLRPDNSATPKETSGAANTKAQHESTRRERSGKIGTLGGYRAWFAV